MLNNCTLPRVLNIVSSMNSHLPPFCFLAFGARGLKFLQLVSWDHCNSDMLFFLKQSYNHLFGFINSTREPVYRALIYYSLFQQCITYKRKGYKNNKRMIQESDFPHLTSSIICLLTRSLDLVQENQVQCDLIYCLIIHCIIVLLNPYQMLFWSLVFRIIGPQVLKIQELFYQMK